MIKINGFDVEIKGHEIHIHQQYSINDLMNIVDYLKNEGFLDMQIWCQENNIF